MRNQPQISSTQHKELMEQVNQLNILRESNSVLRDEKTRLFNEAEKAKSSVKKLGKCFIIKNYFNI
jgi:hypothetical protein